MGVKVYIEVKGDEKWIGLNIKREREKKIRLD